MTTARSDVYPSQFVGRREGSSRKSRGGRVPLAPDGTGLPDGPSVTVPETKWPLEPAAALIVLGQCVAIVPKTLARSATMSAEASPGRLPLWNPV
jgi:hypothetical protein